MKTAEELYEYLKSKSEKDHDFGAGQILNNIRISLSEKYLNRYKTNNLAYWIGFYLADSKIPEAIKEGDISLHQNMAVSWFNELQGKYQIDELQKNIILDIIMTHHTKEYKFIESQIFTNVDALSFLEPKGFMHIFGLYYKSATEANFAESMNIALEKAREKVELIDIDQTTIDTAHELMERIEWMVMRMGFAFQ